MKASIELSLRTREVYQLFERRMNGDKLFIEAILHKLNLITGWCQQEQSPAQATYDQIEKAILNLTHQFDNETAYFENLLQQKKELANKKINFHPQFNCKITLSNRLCMFLANFIESYDKLVATLKLLHLAGCFATNEDCYANVKRLQRLTNQMLSSTLLTPIYATKSVSINCDSNIYQNEILGTSY